MPRFSMVATSASMVLPRRHSATNSARRVLRAAAALASGCSAETATKLTPNKVSTRVVNTLSAPSEPSAALVSLAYGKATSHPSLRPIQFACMVRTRSGQPLKPSSAPSNSSA